MSNAVVAHALLQPYEVWMLCKVLNDGGLDVLPRARGDEFKIKDPIPDNLSFKQLSMAFIEICLRNL
jgi:hypothetical protein